MSDSILGIEDLLGRYQAAGETESSGGFTLDPKKAMERLAQFQLPSRYHWILKIIQSLHLSGANLVDIEAGINRVRIGADTVPTGFANLDDLLAHLLVDSQDSKPALRHMAAGLQGCLAVQPQSIWASLTEDGETRNFVLRSGGWREEESEASPPETRRFQLLLRRNVQEKLSSSWFALNTDIFDLFFKRRGAYDRENAIVYDSCLFSSCVIRLAGKVISQRAFGHPRYPGYDKREPKSGVLGQLFSRVGKNETDKRHHLAEEVVPSTEPGGFHLGRESHATLTNLSEKEILEKATRNGLDRAYAIRMEMSELALVVFVEDGVIIDQKTVEGLDCRGLVGLVNAKTFRKDLTTLKVREDERFQALVEDLREAGRRLRSQVEENLSKMPSQALVRQALLR